MALKDGIKLAKKLKKKNINIESSINKTSKNNSINKKKKLFKTNTKIKKKNEAQDENQIIEVNSDEKASPLSAFIRFYTHLNKNDISLFLEQNNLNYTDIRLFPKRKISFVTLKNEEQLKKILNLNGSKFKDSKLLILQGVKKSESTEKKSKERAEKGLFIKNLPFEVSEEELLALFPSSISVKLPKTKNIFHKNRGYGYVSFESKEAADEAFHQSKDLNIKGRELQIEKLKIQTPPSQSFIPTCLQVKQLSFSVSKEMLKNTFPKCSSARIVLDPNTNKSKGYGFVEFENIEDCNEALRMEGEELMGRKLVICKARKRVIKTWKEKKLKKQQGKKEFAEKTKEKRKRKKDASEIQLKNDAKKQKTENKTHIKFED